jgi:hypothetical protein
MLAPSGQKDYMYTVKNLSLAATFYLLCSSAWAQHSSHGHGHHGHAGSHSEHAGSDSEHAGSHPEADGSTPALGHDPRDASGTAWQPASTPMEGLHFTAGDFSFMLHGSVWGIYNAQSGPRGDDDFFSANWVMLGAQYPLAGGSIGARAMLSAEPATVPKAGYPLLLQTGETYLGVPLVDHQHPHDLFMELALTYSRPITKGLAFQLYIAAAGEPALGPVAFPHRASARFNPLATLGHHWQDSTHITFGVLTAALYGSWWKVEGSFFNGKEPDEERWGMDLRKPNSYSGRLTVNPTDDISAQVSYGFLKNPEAHGEEPGGAEEPDHHGDVHRVTASVAYNRVFNNESNWSSILVYGRNMEAEGGRGSDSVLLESALLLGGHHALFGRAELVYKPADSLALPSSSTPSPLYALGLLSLGYAYQFRVWGPVQLAVGAQGTGYLVPSEAKPAYGSFPAGVLGFLRVNLNAPAGEGGTHTHHPTG